MSETVQEAARRMFAASLAQGYEPRGLHAYVTADGQPVYWRVRMEHPQGDVAPKGRKVIRPIHLNGSGYTFGEPKFEGPKPLYNLDKLAADDTSPVWVVEGEKCADAIVKLGGLATTSGGATSDADADWTPLRGRRCVLWPDNDTGGREYMGRVAARLASLGATVEAVNIDALCLPAKADVVDWVRGRESASYADLEALARIRATLPPADDMPRVRMLCAADLEPEPVAWHWEGWLASGKLTVLAGPPGTGKTTLALAIGATLTIGGRWPDGSRAPTKSIAIWSGEDTAADVLIPRLMANGADRSKVHIVGSVVQGTDIVPFDPARDVPLLAAELARVPDLGLLIIDPLVSSVSGDAHKSNDVRRSLQPIADLAAGTGAAVLGLSHFSKGTAGRDPVERVTGSIAFGAAARLVLGAAKRTEEQGGGRIFVRAKSNLGPDDGGFVYDLEQIELPNRPGVFGSRVMWGEVLEGSAKALLSAAETDEDEDARSALTEARQFLEELLDCNSVPSKLVFSQAHSAGISDATLKRASRELGVDKSKDGLNGPWLWSLPPKLLKSPEVAQEKEVSNIEGREHGIEDAHHKNMSNFGKDEQLRETPCAPFVPSNPIHAPVENGARIPSEGTNERPTDVPEPL